MTASRHAFTARASTDVHVGRVIAVRTDDVEMPGGRVAPREVVEHPGAVVIAALDADDRVMMIHQFRHPVRRRLWELPGGLLDVAGEDPLVTAQRELLEEAGVSATEWSVLVDLVASPGFSDESVRIYLARGLTEVGRSTTGEDDEEADMVTRWVTLSVAVRMVLDGKIVNSATVAGVLAAHALAGRPGRATDAHWPDRPTRFAARRS